MMRQRSPVRDGSPPMTIPLSPTSNQPSYNQQQLPPVSGGNSAAPHGIIHSPPASHRGGGGFYNATSTAQQHYPSQPLAHHYADPQQQLGAVASLRTTQYQTEMQDNSNLQPMRQGTMQLENSSLNMQLDRQQQETDVVMQDLLVTRRRLSEVETLRVQSVCESQAEKQRDQDTIFQLRHQLERQRGELERTRSDNDQLVRTTEATTEAHKMDESALNNLSLENESLKRAIRRKDEITKKAEAVSAQRAKELASTAVAKVKLDQQLGSLGGQLHAARAEIEKLSLQRDSQERHYHVEIQQYKEALQDRRDDLAVKDGRLVSAERDARVGQEQHHIIKAQLHECEAENANLMSQVKELETKYATAVEDREKKVRDMMVDTEARLKELNTIVSEQSENHTTNRAAVQTNVETISKELLALQVENQKLQNQVLLLEAHHSDSKSEADVNGQRCAMLEQQLGEKSAMLDTQRLAVKEKNELLATEKAFRIEGDRKTAQLTVEVSHLRKGTEELTRQVTELSTGKIKLTAELQVALDSARAADGRYNEEHEALVAEQEKVVKLAVEVQGLVNQVSGEERSRWTRDAQLESQERSLTTSKTLYEEKIRSLTEERDAYRDAKETEGRQLRDSHAEELESLRQSYDIKVALAERDGLAESQYLKTTQSQQAQEQDRLIAKYESELGSLKEATAASLQEALLDQQTKLTARHAQEKAEMESKHIADLAAAEKRSAQQQKEWASQVDRLQGELAVAVESCDSLQQRYHHAAEMTRIELEKYDVRLREKDVQIDELKRANLDHGSVVEHHKQRADEELENTKKKHREEVDAYQKEYQDELDAKTSDADALKKRCESEVETLTRMVANLKETHQVEVDGFKARLVNTQGEWDKQTVQHKADLLAAHEELSVLQGELRLISEEHGGMAAKLARAIKEQEESGNNYMAIRMKLSERDTLIDQLNGKLNAVANLEELLMREDRVSDKEYILRSRAELTNAVFEFYSHAVATRKHLKSTFQMTSWRHAVERNYIPDDVGDNLCQVVEDVQWLHDRGHWIVGNFFTEGEQMRLGADPSFFRGVVDLQGGAVSLPTAAVVIASRHGPEMQVGGTSPLKSPLRDHSAMTLAPPHTVAAPKPTSSVQLATGRGYITSIPESHRVLSPAREEVMSPRSTSNRLWPGAN